MHGPCEGICRGAQATSGAAASCVTPPILRDLAALFRALIREVCGQTPRSRVPTAHAKAAIVIYQACDPAEHPASFQRETIYKQILILY